ncbi:MAG: peptidoglycan DD-metalloendopeptidase family protein [Oscillospiraceae bacterium]
MLKAKRLLAAILASLICLTATWTGSNFYIQASAADEDELNDRLDDLSTQQDALKKKKDELQNKINSAKNDKDKQIAIKNQINGRITITRGEINVLTQRIAILEDNINKKEAIIKEKEEEIQENYDLFLQRVRAMYMTGKTSNLELILGAKDFSTALMRAKVMESIADHDKMLIDSLLEDVKIINKEKEALLENKSDIDSSKKELDVKKAELDQELNKTQKEIQSIESLEQQYYANKAQLDKEEAELQSEMQKIYAQLDPAYDEYVGGEFLWPLPNYSQISSSFGWRFNGTNFHTGVDITGGGVNGKPIVSANAGKVVLVVNKFVQGKGYGRYLIVDHGGGMTTLYAHTSKIVVSEGQTVTRGEKIAEVGTTGWSTGPHLHFEVRKDGKAQNPMGYLK